jgi:dTMP kinase
LFITFEGGEGAGKSVQAKLLANFLSAGGKDVLLTREPGGTRLSEAIRRMVLTGEVDKWDPITEALLYLASRSDHWTRKIRPAIDTRKIVICDRFQDSTLVYQGACKAVDLSFLNSVFDKITAGKLPDRTYLIDIDPIIGLERSTSREGNDETRFERLDINFHNKVRDSFLRLAADNKERYRIVDGALSIQEIHEIIKVDIMSLIAA